MTLHEAIGVNVDVDVKTGEKLTHSEIYGRAIELLGGLDAVAPFIPFSTEVLRKAYKKDKFFNTTPIRFWDVAAGFITRCADCTAHGGGLWRLYHQHGIDAASCSDGVCILKEAARRLVERVEYGRDVTEKDKALMRRLLDAGYPLSQMDHHETDLYVYVNALTTRVIKKWCEDNNFDRACLCPTFKDNVTGERMYDCAFQYSSEIYRERMRH